jgi:PBP1b-binding outer membrane lipoprotein LpoB
MRIHAIVQVVIAIMFLMVIVSGCINSNSTNQQVITPAPSAAAVEFQKAGFNAYINGKNELALDYYNKSIAADPYQHSTRRLPLKVTLLQYGTAGEKRL